MQADDDAQAPPVDAPTEGATLVDLVRERLERDGLRPEAAADAIGIPTARLIALLQGAGVNFSTQRRVEAWLGGANAANGLTPDDTGEPELILAMPATAPSEPTPEVAVAPVVEPAPQPASEAPPAKRRGRPPKLRPASEPPLTEAAPAASAAETPVPAAEATATPTPKRRGRPPKIRPSENARPPENAANPEIAMPKRRGRPPKNRDHNATPSAPKRRGRPPKNPAAAAAAPKRRGRPPKAASAASPTVPTAPKRRGRPPKNPAASATGAAEPVMPKRRGRPPKIRSGLGGALREVFALADDELALAVHRADAAARQRVEAALRG